ncbi:MAG: hypothetical protein AB1656_24970 [Candidatus Omnitrophota bacterium]
MNSEKRNPLFKPTAILFAALSLSIGWGIRGNYGHEFGAMLPGALTAMAVCMASGREDWRERLAYFAFFGACGWGFGGSASYGQVIGHTHSGQYATQLWGFYSLFVIGFLWASLGGAATAIPAVWDRQRLTEFFKPFCWVLAAETLLYLFFPGISASIAKSENAVHRHEMSLYWLDSDWIPVLGALLAVLFYDLADRRFGRGLHLSLFALLGAAAGLILKPLFDLFGITAFLGRWLIHYQGDLSHYSRSQLIANWPGFILSAQEDIFWAYVFMASIGLMVGVGYYFYRYGKFRCGASLILHLSLGWYIGFLVLPVFLGVRMTPPRGDNWAGLIGMFLGASVYFLRNGMTPVFLASVVCGIIGGLGFSGGVWLKLLEVSFGNPNIVTDAAIVEAWKHYQSANWHSVLEQTYGFINGLGVLLALSLLLRRVGPLNNEAPRRRCLEGLAIYFALPILTYVNMVKNMEDWTRPIVSGLSTVPPMMKAPLLPWWEFSAEAWFNFFAGAAMLAALILLVIHTRKPIALLSTSWTGRAQLAYLLLLWVFVLGNTAKALSYFHENRLITEGVIILNALLATILALTIPPKEPILPQAIEVKWKRMTIAAVLIGLFVFALAPLLQTRSVRSIYGDAPAGHAGQNLRFGENADWKVAPLLKGVEHR